MIFCSRLCAPTVHAALIARSPNVATDLAAPRGACSEARAPLAREITPRSRVCDRCAGSLMGSRHSRYGWPLLLFGAHLALAVRPRARSTTTHHLAASSADAHVEIAAAPDGAFHAIYYVNLARCSAAAGRRTSWPTTGGFCPPGPRPPPRTPTAASTCPTRPAQPPPGAIFAPGVENALFDALNARDVARACVPGVPASRQSLAATGDAVCVGEDDSILGYYRCGEAAVPSFTMWE